MAARRGRSFGFTMSNEHRLKIANSNILTCLIEHAEGHREMSASQVMAGLGLLKKVLPDLLSTQHSDKEGNSLGIMFTWRDPRLLSSHTHLELSSNPSTSGDNDMQSLSVIEAPEKPEPQ